MIVDVIRHPGPCGRRLRCFRRRCRDEFGQLRTVEIVGNVALFYCHKAIVPVDPVMLRMLDAAA